MDADPQQDSGGFVPGAQLLLAPNLPCCSHIAVGTGTPVRCCKAHTRRQKGPTPFCVACCSCECYASKADSLPIPVPPTHPASTGPLSREPAGHWAPLRGLGCPFGAGGGGPSLDPVGFRIPVSGFPSRRGWLAAPGCYSLCVLDVLPLLLPFSSIP